MHTGVVVGKLVTKEFYGSAHNKSYYLGCSTGGRQGQVGFLQNISPALESRERPKSAVYPIDVLLRPSQHDGFLKFLQERVLIS